MVAKCPGQNTQFWGPHDIYSVECPVCGNAVEFFKDDIRRRCTKCGHMFLNPKLNLGCARWCQFADQCVGAMDRDEFKEIVVAGMKEFYGDDQEKVDQSLEVLGFAEKIMEQQEDVNPKVVIAAAALYGIGVDERQDKAPRSGAPDTERFPGVRNILEGCGARDTIIAEVYRILESHHHPEKADTPEGKLVHDAVQLARLAKESAGTDKAVKEGIHERLFTAAAKKVAEASAV
jgi:hypothetical protein